VMDWSVQAKTGLACHAVLCVSLRVQGDAC
jgi:hypothetical protein